MHLLFWAGYIALLNTETMNMDWGPMAKEKGTLLVPLSFGMIINAILFYSNVYILIPKYLHPKNYRSFFRWSAVLLVCLSLLEYFFDIWYLFGLEVLSPSYDFSITQRDFTNNNDLIIFMSSTTIFNLFFWGLAFLYRWPIDWMRNERQKQQLIHDKLSAELEFLKAQINPHFLFNGINSIYHLIGDDANMAQKVLLKFSDLLRYQLYECKEELIPLKKELHYLKNYLGIEAVRKGEDAIIKIDLPHLPYSENDFQQKIAPLLLTPFLENAFKYLSLHSEKEKNILVVRLSLEDSHLHFVVKNTIDPTAKMKYQGKPGGIGLKNVKRRLALLYPNKHYLDTLEKENCFTVNLKINLT